MRSVIAAMMFLSVVLVSAVADARGAGATRGGAGGGRASRGTPRVRVAPDGPTNPSQCDTVRGVDAYGSSARCLRVLCAGQNLTNAYVLDHAHRLERNPCAGVDPFELRR